MPDTATSLHPLDRGKPLQLRWLHKRPGGGGGSLLGQELEVMRLSDTLPLWIQPRGRRDEVIGLRQDVVAIRLVAPPVEGAANKALCRFIGDRLGVAASRVRIVRGQTSRRKWVTVEGFSAAAVRRVLLEGLPLASGEED